MSYPITLSHPRSRSILVLAVSTLAVLMGVCLAGVTVHFGVTGAWLWGAATVLLTCCMLASGLVRGLQAGHALRRLG